jgi:hypothetical protein
MAYPLSVNTLVPGYASWDDPTLLINAESSKIMPPQDDFTDLDEVEADIGSKGSSSRKTLPGSEIQNQGKQAPMTPGIPDFPEVYSFIGSVFDPDSKGLVQKLKELDPINFETVLLLMRNLSVNLSSPDFEPVLISLVGSEEGPVVV